MEIINIMMIVMKMIVPDNGINNDEGADENANDEDDVLNNDDSDHDIHDDDDEFYNDNNNDAK